MVSQNVWLLFFPKLWITEGGYTLGFCRYFQTVGWIVAKKEKRLTKATYQDFQDNLQ